MEIWTLKTPMIQKVDCVTTKLINLTRNCVYETLCPQPYIMLVNKDDLTR